MVPVPDQCNYYVFPVLTGIYFHYLLYLHTYVIRRKNFLHSVGVGPDIIIYDYSTLKKHRALLREKRKKNRQRCTKDFLLDPLQLISICIIMFQIT
jgi:hypothetical protein